MSPNLFIPFFMGPTTIYGFKVLQFFEGKKTWRYVTGDVQYPKKVTNEVAIKFSKHLEDWDIKNHQIITWIHNTIVPSIYLQFEEFGTIKEVCDFLAKYYTTNDLANQQLLWRSLHSMRQELGQSIADFLSQMQVIWD